MGRFAFHVNKAVRLSTPSIPDFFKVFAALPDLYLVLSPELTILAISDTYVEASLMERSDLMDHPLLEVYPEQPNGRGISVLKASLEQVLATRQPHQMEVVRYSLPDPARANQPVERYWATSHTPVLDEAGAVQYIIQRTRDVTEERRIEARLRALQEQEQERQDQTEQQFTLLQTLLDQSPVAMCLYQDADLVITSANQLMCSIWGYPAQQVVGRPMLEGVPELQGQDFDVLIQEVLATGVPYRGQETPAQLMRDGQLNTCYFDFVYHPLRNEQETIIGVVAVAVEVTEQVEARQQLEAGHRKEKALNEELAATNEELRAANEELGASRNSLEQLNEALEERVALRTQEVKQQAQTFDTTLAALQDFVYTFDTQGRFAYANQRLLNLLGITLDEIVGKTFHQLPYPLELAEALMRDIFQVVASRQSVINETPFTDPSGNTGYYEYILQPVFDADQRVIGVVGSARDITHRKQSEEKLRVKNEELMRTNTDLDNFIYTASHDLKAPISNIEALLAALLRTLPPDSREDERTQRITDMMQKSVERFKRTIANLTEVVKLQKDNSEAAVEIDLAEVVREVRLDLEPLIRSSGVQLTVDLEECPAVYFSKKNLRSVVYNLLSNAIKYRSPDRVATVLIRSQRTATHDLLTVTDNGLGMGPGRRDQLFGMFKRFHDHVEGTGIGLYMVKKIVENAGGKIEVSSALDQGSTFQVYFKQKETTDA